ncbi:MAG TPA: glycoside hydrolase family 97 N-terminal domain-containing protein, partial [Opitutaceae bacterium]|nr:glycoside hydrolase family 97 N-terminal domain-containing protein [Opitutaceae bacterium]
MKPRIPLIRTLTLGLALVATSLALDAEETLTSPNGRVVVAVSDADGLHYRVTLDGQPALADSRLGLEFSGGVSLGRTAKIAAATRTEHDSSWENAFGARRVVPDHYRELKLELAESADASHRLNLIVRA